MYATLEGVDAELIETIASLDCVAKYLDMPLQHVHPATLRRMKRPYSADRALHTLGALREAMPDLALRSTFVVGFPGETDEEFQYLLDFLPAAQLDWVTAFAYSEEAGTTAAAMPDQVAPQVRRRRRRAVYAAQAPVSRARNRRLIGRRLTVLGEAIAPAQHGDGQVLVARSQREAPEVDGRVLVRGLDDCGAMLDRMLDVEVVGAATYQVTAMAVDVESTAPRRRTLQLLPVAVATR
jgi:ribosomal protein S12 methylthiotransferase